MIAEKKVLQVEGNLTGEKIRMSFDENSTAFLQGIFIDLYSDPELAIVREISTNALDAHIEAGITRPIEITLPTSLAPFLTIKDYGLGLSEEDIRDIYSKYGASTKRESNDAVGMLGLGCKSPLTYADQFTLTGIKNGICIQVSISRDEDGGGSMTVIDQFKTDVPSGVEVIIPAKKFNSIEAKAKEFFSFWREGTVLVNGKAPKRIDGLWLADDLLLTETTTESYVVMGNVPYPIPEEFKTRYGRGNWDSNKNRYAYWNTVAFVNIGDVNFTPSREQLQMTKKTKETLTKIMARVNKEREAAIQREINAASTGHEAIQVYLDALSMGISNKQFTYNGVDIPDKATAPFHYVDTDQKDIEGKTIRRKINEPFLHVNSKRYYGDSGWGRTTGIPVSQFKSTIWFIGHDGADFSPYKRKKLEQWCAEKKITAQHFVLVNEVPLKDWIDPVTVHPWQEVADQKIIRNVVRNRDGRPTGSYEIYDVDKQSKTIQADEIDTSKPIFYCAVIKDYSYHVERNSLDVLYSKGYTLVILGRNRINKFQRDFPKSKEVNEYLKDKALKWSKKLSDEDKKILYFREATDHSIISTLDHTKIDDPELAEFIRLASAKNPYLFSRYLVFRQFVSVPTIKSSMSFKKYPLYENINTYATMDATMKNHVYLYFNAAYAAERMGV